MNIISVYSESDFETKIMFKRSDNVVAVKRNIRKAIYLNETKMQLFCGDKQLKDNEYITDYFTSLTYRELPERSNDIIITVARNTLRIPELIQISPDETISDLKTEIKDVSDIGENIAIFDENGNEFCDEHLVKDCELFNDSVVKICLIKDCHLTLAVSRIPAKEASFNIECEITDLIKSVKDIIRAKLNLSSEMSLFVDSSILKDDDRMIDYSFRNNNSLFYILIDRAENFTIGKRLKSGKFAKIFMGENLLTKSNIVLKRYNLKPKKIHKIQPFTSELTNLMNFENYDCEEFVKLDCIFQTLSHFYIGMEFMENGSLDAKIPLKPNEIIKYSMQVLNALEFLHGKKIVYRNLKCSNLLLNASNDVKLCNFHLSKNLMDFQSQKVVENRWFTIHINYNWTAPEVLARSRYDIAADIWSFGAMLIEMRTGKPPYSELSPEKVRSEIQKTKTIEYDKLSNPSNDLDNVISVCLERNPDLRPKVERIKNLMILISNPTESGNP